MCMLRAALSPAEQAELRCPVMADTPFWAFFRILQYSSKAESARPGFFG